MRTLPADLKVPVADAVDPTKVAYKALIDPIYKPVE